MVFYFVSDHYKRGGIESIHQYCYYFNECGMDSYILYFPFDETEKQLLYADEYPLLKIKTFQDMQSTASEKDVVFLPEIVNVSQFMNIYMPSLRVQVGMMWLSLDYGLSVWKNANIHEQRIKYHMFQSSYAMHAIANDLKHNQCFWLVPDVTRKCFMEQIGSQHELSKQDMVAYNPAKDMSTPILCKTLGIPCVALANMTSSELVATLEKCKVYVDFGSHPGKDRMPREAACMGCVVITNLEGSAAYWNDIPIHEKIIPDLEGGQLIRAALDQYPYFLRRQTRYLDSIQKEEDAIRRAIYVIRDLFQKQS